MRNKKNDEFFKFAEFLSSDSDDGISSKESMKRLQDTIAFQLERASKFNKKAWISRASEGRKKFEASASEVISKISGKYGSRNDLLEAIKNGVLGGGAKQNYQLQFRGRNADELSDSDLLSIIGDQEILELLKKSEKKK